MTFAEGRTLVCGRTRSEWSTPRPHPLRADENEGRPHGGEMQRAFGRLGFAGRARIQCWIETRCAKYSLPHPQMRDGR